MGKGGHERGGVLLAAAALIAAPLAHAGLGGDPPFARHVPDIEAYPQNFAVAQDAQGVAYVGNFDGVLVYDGERWSVVAMPRRELVRSLQYDGGRRVYVGSYDAFGYLERDAAGHEVYHDLTPAFAGLLKGETFADIWNIQVGPEGVFFRALRHVFLYRPDTGAVKLWRHAGRFGGLTRFDGAPVLQFRGEGLRRFVNGEWQRLPGTGSLTELVSEPLALPEGALLLPGPDGHWRTYRAGRVQEAAMPPGFPPPSSISGAMVTADGSLAFATDNGVVLLLDRAHSTYRSFRVDPGYLTNLVAARDGGLLVASDDALYHIQWPSPWTVLGTEHGLQSSLHAVASWAGRWFGLTASGVHAVESAGGRPALRRLDWTASEAWDLEPVDAQTALLAETYAVKLVEGGRARAVTHNALYPRQLQRSRFDPDIVFVGTEPGFAVLRRTGGTWALVLEQKEMGDPNVLDIVETARGELWLGSERGGVWRLRLASDYSGIAEVRQFLSDGLEYGEVPGAHLRQLPDGSLVASTVKGFFVRNGERFEKTAFDGLDRARGADEWLSIEVAPGGERWAHSYKHLYRQVDGGWRRVEVGGLRRGAMEHVTFGAGGAPVVSSSYAILQFDPARAPAASPPPRVMLRAVQKVEADGSATALPLGGDALEIAHGAFSLNLRYALPAYERPESARYSARLAGIEEQFSEWSDEAARTYPRLPAGAYTFELRARDGQGRESTLAPLAIRILPRWYETVWAQVAWGLLTSAVLFLLMLAWGRLRTRRLAADKVRLEGMVASRTVELEELNKRLDEMARLDALTGVSNRRELDRRLEETWRRYTGSGAAMSVLAIDVDRFKNYNDRYGHVAGDEMLVKLVKALADGLKGGGDHLLARYGGDEFFVVLDGLEGDEARGIAEALRRRVEDGKFGATVSIGVASGHPRDGGTVKQLVRAADAALYVAKAAGRNQVAVGEDEKSVTHEGEG